MNSDTNLCYISEKYPSTIFGIEKKMESEEDVRPSLTPLMVDFDGDCVSEILVTGNDGHNQLFVIDPTSGKTIKKIVTYFNLSSASPYAVADVDNDGHIEIVMAIAWYQTMPANIRGKLICFDINGNLKWVSDQRFDNGNLYKLSGAPAFADFNQDGIPEVYIHNVIFNARNGIKIADGGINGIGAGGELPPVPAISLSIAAQLDDDIADLELAAGYTVYKVSITNPNGMTGNSMIPHNMRVDNEFIDGFTTVADINLDGILDIVVASNDNNNAKLFVYSMNNGFPVLLAKSTLSSGTDNYIGPPIIADINGSGIMSIIVNTPNQLHSFKYDGNITLAKEWNLVVQDVSGYSGLTIFDLNNDGKKEIIYRDEGYLRIINVDLNIPKELTRIGCPAPSREENPIVGGIDSSGHARICVICNNIDSTGGKLYIFGPPDSLPDWAPARGIWNQYNYHVLNINDDLTVPRVQKNNATYKNGKYNNFYVQESLLDSNGMYLKRAASLTGKIKCINYDPFNDEYTVIFDIYNLANASFKADSSLPVSFYNGDPATTGILIGVYYTFKKIEPGDSLLSLQYTFTTSNLSDLFMVINTSRNKTGAFDPVDFTISECDYTDNAFHTLVLPKDKKANPCNTNDIDSNLCYIKEKYPASKFAIEKKLESLDTVFPMQISLLADIDGDCVPELIVPVFSEIVSETSKNKILIIDSKSGQTKLKINTPYHHLFEGDIAIADIDYDGVPEIFLKCGISTQYPPNINGKLICYNLDNSIKWISDQQFEHSFSNPVSGKLGLADFNHDGIAEIYINNKIFNAQTGIQLADGGLNGLGSGITKNSTGEALTIAAQLDVDSTDLELAAGFTVYKVKITNPNGMSGNKMTPMNIRVDNTYRDGNTTVADVNLDGMLDIVVTSPGFSTALVYVYTILNGMPKLIAKAYPSGVKYPNIGPALIGDIKGSGKPSIVIARESTLRSYFYDGTTTLQALWTMTTNDVGGFAALTMFDFNNDGVQEIVYRDEDNLEIIDGSTIPPREIAKIACYSWTWDEFPIVGDLDNTGHAKICVPCYSFPFGGIGKLTVFGPPDSLPGWAPARSIWNQYNYHVLNINDDLTVPRVQKNNATYKNGKYNNFLVQESLLDSNGMYKKPAASLTGKIKSVNYDSINKEYTVTFDLYNLAYASARADSNLPVSFYNGDPATTGILIGVYYTFKKIEPGDSLLSLQYTFTTSNLSDLFMVINTTRDSSGVFGSSNYVISECDYSDNLSHIVVSPKTKNPSPCNTLDTSLCYSKVKNIESNFVLEKKIESKDTIEAIKVPLLADMDGDCIPEFILSTLDERSILIIDSRSGKTKWKINTPYISYSVTSLALADLDNDKIPEIFVVIGEYIENPINVRGRLVCYNANGSIRWISDQKAIDNFGLQMGSIPSLADFNQDGIAEIYTNNRIFNAQTGIKLADGGANGIGRGPVNLNAGSSPMSIAAQLDEDALDLELAAGYTVYKVSITNINGTFGNKMTPHNIFVENAYHDGYTTVADINSDGKLDIIVSSPTSAFKSLVYAYAFTNGTSQLIARVIPNVQLPEMGPAFIGYINSSGRPSIMVTRDSLMLAYSYDGSSTFKLDWKMTTNNGRDESVITVFDLNNDGINEIIYRDMTDLNIIDGSGIKPLILTKTPCASLTQLEYAIVGDFDNTGHAKICVPCAVGNDNIRWRAKLTIFGPPDSLPGWAPARNIWNQYNYHALNINDDLTVPRVQKNNATYKNGKYNNFFVQESLLDSNGMYLKRAASLTGKIKCINYDPITNEYTVIFDIYNRTDASFNADSSLPVSFYNGDPVTGGILIGTYYTLKELVSGDSLLNLEFKFTVANLSDLFMVVNTTRNGSGQFDPTDFSIAECDYTDNIFRTLDLPKIEKLNASICKGASYNFYNTLLKNAGMYFHTLNNVNGCDSLIFILELTTVDTIYTRQSAITCDSYSWNGQTLTQSGTFIYDTLSQFGCDSITTLDLLINKSNHINLQHTACDSFTWNGTTYDKSGSYPYQTVNRSGCDSISTLELVINNSDDQVINHTACISYTWNGQIYNQSGTYKFDTVNRFGCDSTISLNLTVNSVINVNSVDAACDAYTWNGNTYSQSGTYQFKTINQQGCDSITTLQLTINKSNNSTTSLTTCDSYSWNGISYSQSGTYQYKTLNTAGCDSTAILQLTINKSTNSITNSTSCDRYVWNGNTYTQSGSYQFQTLNAAGCDSLASLNLIIKQSDTLDLNQTACDTFSWNGNTYDKSGNYPYQSINSLGCDSIINLNLTINKSTKADLALSVCDSINFLGTILKTNGIYPFKIQNSEGCDSVINLSLNIRSENYSNAVTRCDSFSWNLTNQSYNQSGVYIQKYVNSYGCDSTYLLDLTINKSYEELQQAKACKEYVWKVNNNLLNQSGEYRYPLKSNAGCDSILILNLSIYQDFEKTDTVITDSVYTWPINQIAYTKSGIYREVFSTHAACDSIRTLVLIIKKTRGIYYPNVIRPGGPNGWFTIFDNGSTIEQINSLSIYDRWGDLIWQKQGFAANTTALGWDGSSKGKSVLPGVYVWHAQLALRDGSITTEKGDVTVLR